MRSGYSNDLDQRDLALWRGRVASASRGKRGQTLFKTLLKALDAMPVKRLVAHDLVNGYGDVCTLGAGGKLMEIQDLVKIDPEDHHILADRFDVSACLIQEIEYMNDEGCPNYDGETPEQRYERMRDWLIKQIKN